MTSPASQSPWRELRWPVIIGLGAVGLARPILSVAGVYDDDGALPKPGGPLLLTAVISLIWLVAAVVLRLKQPVLSLALVGVAYSVLAILMNLVLQPILDSAESIPVPGMIAMTITNAIQGAILGLIAWLILRALHNSRRGSTHAPR